MGPYTHNWLNFKSFSNLLPKHIPFLTMKLLQLLVGYLMQFTDFVSTVYMYQCSNLLLIPIQYQYAKTWLIQGISQRRSNTIISYLLTVFTLISYWWVPFQAWVISNKLIEIVVFGKSNVLLHQLKLLVFFY